MGAGLQGSSNHLSVFGGVGGYQLMEPVTPYKVDFDPEKDLLSFENTYIWDDTD